MGETNVYNLPPVETQIRNDTKILPIPTVADDIAASRDQKLCCCFGCYKRKNSRTRFSLRLNPFVKKSFVKKSWDKICDHCYFADYYAFGRKKKKEEEKHLFDQKMEQRKRIEAKSKTLQCCGIKVSKYMTVDNRELVIITRVFC
jgi:hypothetical protein